LTVRLCEEFTRRGLKVATIKHAHHTFQIDVGEADSARHRRAGAQQVVVVSKARWAVIKELGDAPEPGLSEVIAWLDPCDLIIVEGYKRAEIPKIEVRRVLSQTRPPLANSDPQITAIAADHAIHDASVPVYALDDIAGIADHIERIAGPFDARRQVREHTGQNAANSNEAR
jgi:molybdopterin-guanine dinucleotide biosynthesis protein B